MDTKAFLGMVLPGAGRYCAAIINQDAPVNPVTKRRPCKHKWFSSVQELAAFYERVEKRGKRIDCYHAVSTFAGTDHRKQKFVHRIRSVFFDLDCGAGKAFPNQRAALVALTEFITEFKLPVPLIVSSGWGIHAYWTFDRDLTPAEWQPLADALKAAAAAHGLKIDAGITGDSARILRTPGTTNHKFGKRRRAGVVDEGDGPITPAILASALSGARRGKQGQSKPNGKGNGHADDFFGDLRSEMPKADARILERECGQVRDALTDPDAVTEPVWYRLLGLAAFTTGEEKTAHRWSKSYHNYDPEETQAKYDQWTAKTTGPPTCAYFKAENPAGCKGCPHKLTTPVQIILTPPSEKVKAAPEMPTPPVPYFIKDGRTYRRTSKVDKGKGITVEEDELVYRSIIYPVRYYNDPDTERDMVEWQWMDEHDKLRGIVLPARITSGGGIDYRNQMADSGIGALNEVTGPLLKEFMNVSYQVLRLQQPADVAVRALGWQPDFKSFALGEVLYTKNGTQPTQTSSNVARISEGYGIKGTMGEWLAMTRILGEHDMYPQQIAIGIGMASILMPFTGLSGAVVSLFGPTGTGKTTAENMQQAVWGNPAKLVRGAKATANALYGNFASLGNMPVALDEASKTVAGNVGELLYSISVGAEKERMDASATVRARKLWCLIALITGNQSFAAQLASAGDVSDAQQRRLLELEVTANPALTASMDMGKKLQRMAYTSHGHVGVEWVKFLLAAEEEKIRAMIDQAEQALPALGYKGDGTDRFHTTIAALVLMSLTVAKEAGWIAFNPRPAIKWMLGQLASQKERQEETTDDHFDLVNLFRNHRAQATLIVTNTEDGITNPDYSDTPRWTTAEGIVARCAWWRKAVGIPAHRGTLYISRDALANWLRNRGTDIDSVLNKLHEDGALLERNRKVILGAGTIAASGQVRCIALDLFHPRMITGTTAPRLRLVKGQRPQVDLA